LRENVVVAQDIVKPPDFGLPTNLSLFAMNSSMDLRKSSAVARDHLFDSRSATTPPRSTSILNIEHED